MSPVIIILAVAACGAAGMAAVSLTMRSRRLRRAWKAPYRGICYRVLTAVGRNYTGLTPVEWSRTVAIARTQRSLADSCRTLETDGRERLVETPLGRFWIPDTGREVYEGFLLTAAEELHNHYRFDSAAYVVDCGANLGTFTRLALNREAKTVVAVEPAPELVRCLRRTFAREISEGRVILVEKGLWDKEDRLFLRTSEDCWNNTIVANGDGRRGVWVSLTTLDNVVAGLDLPSVDFIKMDIEGAEVRALDGAGMIIRRWKPVISVATEHTDDKLANTAAVVAAANRSERYSDLCVKGSIMRTRSFLGVRFPSSVMPEIILLRPENGSLA